ncbi:putative AB5 enterotoxin ADP-ribosylating subunit YtxA [Yersinia sp. 2545 StPb PI]|uniref:putative AB5 enterotoxin ADP-ribosylating subunit YtxA n=1 Tax=Yersinia sp. 2545 StPb PI TaxID=3117410 RepID=UPI003FA43331
MKRCQLMVLLFIYYIITMSGWAKPPDIVWRVDTRDYQEIFSQGFHSLGDNDSVVEHLSGRSCRGDHATSADSIFISTTADKSFAYNYLERVLKKIQTTMGSDALVYLYQIRADSNMYSADYTLDFILRMGASGMQQELHHIFRYSPFLSEWMAHSRILGEQIMSATSYLLRQGKVIANEFMPNPLYRQTRSSASANPYHNAFIVPPVLNMMRTWILRMGIRPMIRACFGSMESTKHKRSMDSIYQDHSRMFKLIVIL